jgi:SAM-dependent methyltransferase
MPRVDYDQIAHLYDEPMRDHAVDAHLLQFVASRPDLGQAGLRVLDVGCGTGKQLAADRRHLPEAQLVGVDRFRGMLRIAARHGPDIGWVHGDGTRLPLASASFDYATNQFSYHHIADKNAFVRELFRVLRPGGRFVMTNIDPWSMLDWAIYRYFPEAFERDESDCLTSEVFCLLMTEAGFVEIHVDRRVAVRPLGLDDFLAYASDRHRTSQFIAISDAAYEQGLDRLRRDVAEAGASQPTVDLGVCLLTISGDRPAGD